MKKVVVNMQNYLMSQAIERVLKSSEVDTVVVDQPEQVAESVRLIKPDVLLLEVTGYDPWRPEQRLQLRDCAREDDPACKVVLIVDENSDREVAEQVKRAKVDGLIDLFIYGSVSASYLTALIETV